MVDIPGDRTTSATISVGGSVNGSLEFGSDHDFYRLTLTAGQVVRVSLSGLGASALEDPYLRIRDSAGNVIFENDDGGADRDSMLVFKATYSGTYYVDVAAWDDASGTYQYTGNYQLSVQPYTPPPVGTVDDFATQLTTGYWDGASHHFNVGPGGTLNVNLINLTTAGQGLARQALAQWTDILGITFREVSTGGQIVFDDNEDGAFSSSAYSNGIISSSKVNVSTQWLADYGTTIGTYSFQSYVHEIGHALGLGHAGNYNNEASFPFDATYANDGWPMSIMSYFDQNESTYYDDLGFSRKYVGTPMVADILAVSRLYGLSTTTRTDNSTYGYHATVNDVVYHASLYTNIAYTIFDSGGTDTLDYSLYSGAQMIDLRTEHFMNVIGGIGNVSIARGVVIENALGGEGSDDIYGNDVINVLRGNGGNDHLYGFGGDDTLDGGAGSDVLDGGDGNDRIIYDAADAPSGVNGGAGFDTLVMFNVAAPTQFNLIAHGFDVAERTVTDSGANSWSSILQTYSAEWALRQQIIYNDDSSRVTIDYDFTNASDTKETWRTFDTLGRLADVDTLFDNGGHTFINIDEANAQPWSQNWLTFDALGRLADTDTVFDFGGHTFVDFDEANAQSWSQNWLTFDTSGRLDSQDIVYDNGTHTFINYDQDNSQAWSQVWFTYDNQGRLDTQDIVADDGSHVFYNWDQAGTESFQWNAYLYNSSGTPYQQVVHWDDGRTSYYTL